MKRSFCWFTLIIFFAIFLGGASLPLPFLGYQGLTAGQQQIMNDRLEVEGVAKVKNSGGALLLDWSAVDQMFKFFENVLVIDCQTGCNFFVQRTGGKNHADVEPIDNQNMLNFLSCAQNPTSARRPVWVKLGEIWVAGSLSGLPHGYSNLSGNGLDGHLCLHFLNSKTHATKKPDSRHQKAVKKSFQLSKLKQNKHLFE